MSANPYADRIRARLRLLIEIRGMTLASLARHAGVSRAYFQRKFQAGSRAFRLEDVDQILDILGERPGILERPIFLDRDIQILAYIEGCPRTRERMIALHPWCEAGLDRLLDQGFIERDEEGDVLRATPEGIHALRSPENGRGDRS